MTIPRTLTAVQDHEKGVADQDVDLVEDADGMSVLANEDRDVEEPNNKRQQSDDDALGSQDQPGDQTHPHFLKTKIVRANIKRASERLRKQY